MIEEQCTGSDNPRLEQDEIENRIRRLTTFLDADAQRHTVRFGRRDGVFAWCAS